MCGPWGGLDDGGAFVHGDNIVVRPAFNLNPDAVLFTSAAVDGKPDGGLTPISEHTGNEWKLTLLDNSRNFAVTEKGCQRRPRRYPYAALQWGDHRGK